MRDTNPNTTLLLACIAPPHAAQRERLCTAAAGIADWPELIRMAGVHRLAPLLASRLRTHMLLETLPAPARTRLEQLYLASATRQIRMQEALQMLCARLQGLGIDVLPQRGPALAVQLGIDPATRPSDDLDLLVHRRDLDRARAALIADGFAPIQRLPTAAAMRHAIRAGGAHVLERPGSGFQVDLAWTAVPCYFAHSITLDRLAPHRRGAMLTREALLVLLCLHGTKHLWSRHAWTHDVAALLAPPGVVDWDAAGALARSFGGERMLRLGVAWASRVTGLPVTLARDATVAALCDALAARFDARPDWIPADDRERAGFHLRVQDGAAGRLRYLAWRLFVPTANDWRAMPLPAPLAPLYALLRPLRLLARAAMGCRGACAKRLFPGARHTRPYTPRA